MRKAAISIVLVLPAGAALADPGGHLHPHGGETWFAVLGAAAGLAALRIWFKK